MKYALIGCGRIAPNHIQAALACGMEVVALCDVSAESALKRKEEFHLTNAKVYTDYKQMLAENKLDVVSLGVASGFQPKIVLDCLDFKVHLIIEKPIAMNLHDADRMIEKADRLGVKIAVCQQNRFNVAIQAVRKALEAGRFGKLSHGSIAVRWHRGPEYYAMAPWRGTWERDGGVIMNQCIHGIDILRWMLGDEIDEVYGVTRRRLHDIEAEDLGMAVVKFSNGTLATVEGTSNVYGDNLEERLCLFGEKGYVVVGGKSLNKIEHWEFQDATEEDEKFRGFVEETENVYGNGHNVIFSDMKEAIENHRTPYVDIHCGRRALELILAIYKSQKENAPVKFPIKEFGSTDMKGVSLES